jgi:hypothetical protein
MKWKAEWKYLENSQVGQGKEQKLYIRQDVVKLQVSGSKRDPGANWQDN